MMQKLKLSSILIISLSLCLLSCSGDNDSGKIEVTQVASKPVVINSNFTIDPTPGDSNSGDEIDVSGPWFPVRFVGSNPTVRDLTIASFTVEVTGRDSNGTSNTVTWVPDLGNANIILTASAGEVFEMTATAFVDSLPESVNGVYSVKMKFEGWFNVTVDDPNTSIDESTQPDENFQKTITFITQ